jgi:tRNA (Thr-GGU) A37 N-methylase
MTTAENAWAISPIGVVSSPRDEVTDDEWGMVRSSITLLPPFDASSLRGLEQFSHIEVIYLLDRVDPSSVCLHARRPRDNPAWPEVGIFAQRAKERPNRRGLSTCELLGVEDHTIQSEASTPSTARRCST